MANKKQKTPPPPKPEEDKRTIFKADILPWAVFIPTLVIVFISLISVVFPALITRATSILQADVLDANVVSPYEPGFLAGPLIGINLAILGIGVVYYKRSKGAGILKSISKFELSRKRAIIAVIVLLVIFSATTAGTLVKEEIWEDYIPVKDRLQTWTISDFGKSFEPSFRYLLLSASLHIFGNIRVVPFITSIALLLLTYFFTANITQKRFAGIVSMTLLLQSDIFISYGTAATYDNSWILLYLFSLYLIEKFWSPSPVPYFLSIFSKALTVAFLPMSLYFIARSSLPRKSKIYSLGSYGAIVMLLLVAIVILGRNIVGTSIGFSATAFWQGFTAMAMQMRFDYIVILFLLPLIVMLFFASRRGVLHADSVMIFILSILLIAPLLVGFTQQTNQPYRFVSLSVFFAIGVGVLLSNRTRRQVEVSSSM
ncbi:MAG: hypothetical protein ACREA3_04635 [Nitrosotalea sp.]